jgi:hypothetical protein
MSELRTVREVARKSLQALSAEAEVPLSRLWKAEHGYTELTPEERAALDRVLMPALSSSIRVVSAYQRSRQVAS